MTEEVKETPKPETVTVSLYNPNDGLAGREGGPYLDRVQAWEREKERAFQEGRDPDPENMAFTTSWTAAQLLAANNVTIPSKAGESSLVTAQKYVDAMVESGASTLKPIGEIEVEVPSEAAPVSSEPEPEPEPATSTTTASTSKTTASKTASSSSSGS